MDIHEIRRDNFLALASEHRNMAELCRLTGVTTAQGSQIKTRKGRMGDAIARRVEQRLGLSSGWMDTPQPRKAGLSDDEQEVLAAFRAAHPEARRVIRAVLANVANAIVPREPPRTLFEQLAPEEQDELTRYLAQRVHMRQAVTAAARAPARGSKRS